MEQVIGYHGTTYDYKDKFVMPEELFRIHDFDPEKRAFSYYICKWDFLGVWFSESEDCAYQFCKERWDLKDSPLKPDSKIYKVSFTFERPKIIYPIDHCAMGGMDFNRIINYRRHLIIHHQHDSLIINQKPQGQYFGRLPELGGDEIEDDLCEYRSKQYCLFDINNIKILEVKKLN